MIITTLLPLIFSCANLCNQMSEHPFRLECAIMNDNGKVAGEMEENEAEFAFLLEENNLLRISFGEACINVEDLNDQDQILLDLDDKPFLWDAQNGLREISIPVEGYNLSAVSLNNKGQVFLMASPNIEEEKEEEYKEGIYIDIDPSSCKKSLFFIWEDQKELIPISIFDLIEPSYCVLPGIINDKGQISFILIHAEDTSAIGFCIWEEGKLTQKYFPEGEEKYFIPFDLNNRGDVVGIVGKKDSNEIASRLWFNDGSTVTVGEENHEIILIKINDLGQAVGEKVLISNDIEKRAILWSEKDGLQDLNNLFPQEENHRLIEALDINNKGQILLLGQNNSAEFNAIVNLK